MARTAVEVAVVAADLVAEAVVAVEVIVVAADLAIDAAVVGMTVVEVIVDSVAVTEEVVVAAVIAMDNKAVLVLEMHVPAIGRVLILAVVTQTLPGEIPVTVVRHLSLEEVAVVEVEEEDMVVVVEEAQ